MNIRKVALIDVAASVALITAYLFYRLYGWSGIGGDSSNPRRQQRQ